MAIAEAFNKLVSGNFARYLKNQNPFFKSIADANLVNRLFYF
jgi:hypothetical protein